MSFGALTFFDALAPVCAKAGADAVSRNNNDKPGPAIKRVNDLKRIIDLISAPNAFVCRRYTHSAPSLSQILRQNVGIKKQSGNARFSLMTKLDGLNLGVTQGQKC